MGRVGFGGGVSRLFLWLWVLFHVQLWLWMTLRALAQRHSTYPNPDEPNRLIKIVTEEQDREDHAK